MLGYQENRYYSNRLQACISEFKMISHCKVYTAV